MTYISKYLKLDSWRKSLIFSLVSSLFIAFTYIDPPPDSGYGGAVFYYTISFFFPMLGLSVISGLIAVRSLLRFMDGLKTQTNKNYVYFRTPVAGAVASSAVAFPFYQKWNTLDIFYRTIHLISSQPV